MELDFEAVSEGAPGARWQALFRARWPAYKAWYLAEGIAARPTYLQCRTALRRHMPELMPTYERLCALAGGSDLSARFLSLYRPPPYISGCSQAVWRGGEPVLVRNYDYDPRLCDGLILDTAWSGGHVIASIDCLWGCLDGMNEAGLAVSLSFGGRRAVGDGFGIPIVLRYVLEFCRTAAEAAEVLQRVPTHMAYNVTAIDRTGAFFTAQLSPDRPALVDQAPLATNHQGDIEWQRHADATASVERERFLVAPAVEASDERAAAGRCLPPAAASFEGLRAWLRHAVYGDLPASARRGRVSLAGGLLDLLLRRLRGRCETHSSPVGDHVSDSRNRAAGRA